VVAEDVLKRFVEEVCSRVIRNRREAHVPRHEGANPVALREALPLEEQDLIVLEAIRLAELRT
jgi:hypothetical protein